jgi:putative addiction module component (TIGR02574 family)
MSASFEKLEHQAMELTEGERTELAYRLLDSVGPPDPHANLTDAEFGDMLVRRLREVETGAVEAIPADQVLRELRAKYASGE